MKDKSSNALFNASKIGGGDVPPCAGAKSSALPEVQKPLLAENSHTGVSTSNASSSTKHWYAMRTTYGRELKAYDYIISNGGIAFLPLLRQEKVINGKKTFIEVSRIPNIFFVYGKEEDVKAFAFDNVHLPYLRFYYRSHFDGVKIIKEPLIVPDNQIRSLQILCEAEVEDVRLVPDEMIQKFRKGDLVLIIEGELKGIEGRVARWHGQQRVAIIIDGLCVIATAYVPSSFLRKVNS